MPKLTDTEFQEYEHRPGARMRASYRSSLRPEDVVNDPCEHGFTDKSNCNKGCATWKPKTDGK